MSLFLYLFVEFLNVNPFICIYERLTRPKYITELHHGTTIVYLSDISEESTLSGRQVSQVALLHLTT